MTESVVSLFNESVKRFGKRPAIQYFSVTKNKWITENWVEIDSRISRLANALKSTNLAPGDKVAILSLTRPDWVVADLAIMKISSVVVPIYHSSLSDQIGHIIADSGARIIFVENEEQLQKVRLAQKSHGTLELVILFDSVTCALNSNETYLADFVKSHSDQFVDNNESQEKIATLVYTSGTTGDPKGAMITHDNLLYEAQAIDKLGILDEFDVQLIFLPLAHIFARVLEIAWIRTGHLLAFSQSIEKVVDDMGVVKPTFMAGVPRIFEKVRDRVIEGANESGAIKRAIANFAFGESDRMARENGKSLFKKFLIKKLVFSKISARLKERFGGRLRFLISGGAALSVETAMFFELCDIIICEGYGLTESTAATCLNLPWARKLGSVGRAVPGTDVRLSEDGEILIRGRGVFLGFFNKEEETKEVLDAEGFLHSGDIGKIDAEGYVTLIDRKKDIIVTSQGKNISPQRVENLIKAKSPIIAHALVVGEKKPYLTALIALERTAAFQVAANNGAKNLSMLELSANASVYQEVKNAIASANASLASFEQIKRFAILDKEFEVGVELTPTLKIKRKECSKRFQSQIKVLYA